MLREAGVYILLSLCYRAPESRVYLSPPLRVEPITVGRAQQQIPKAMDHTDLQSESRDLNADAHLTFCF